MTGRNPTAEADRYYEAARTLHRQGRLVEAEREYRTAIGHDAHHGDAKEWLGVLCLQRGDIQQALRLLTEAVALCPEKETFHGNLAVTLLQAKRPEEAAATLARFIATAPEAIESRKMLGDVLLHLQRRNEAMGVYKDAIDLDPQLRDVCRDTSQIPNEEERCNAIVENCGQILSRYPNYAPGYYGKACALLNLGRIEEACRTSEQALVLNPTVPTYYHVIIHTGGPAAKSAAISALETLARSEAALDDQDRVTLHFLLAKAYGDQKRPADTFAHLQKGNTIKRGMVSYDETRELGRMRAIAGVFTPGRVQALQGSGHPSQVPVFVVGMPRSGTTLVEQILASHPDVHGAGELTYLPDLVTEGLAGADFPAGFNAVTAGQLHRLGEAYVSKLAAIAPGAGRIVDKMPNNFLHAGLIHLALPDARIIHVTRDPLDTCFSCYSQTFAGDLGYTYDLAELGRYYRAYDALMAHWRTVLPATAMLEVQYEALVNDLPAEARRLVAYCGLDWDDRCVEFHKTRRAIVTASVYQVRQPVYRSSVRRAQAYADYLAPLRQALGLS